MNEFISLLQTSSLFASVEEEQLQKELLPHGRVRSFPKGSCLLLPGERLEHFGMVIEGRLQTQHIFSDGSYSILEVAERGELFGADLLCTRSRISPYHSFASEDCRLLLFPCSLMEEGVLSQPLRQRLLEALLLLVANSNMQKEYRLAILSRKGLRERIMTYLEMQAAKRQTNSFTIPFSREELASFLCVNRSALSHELSQMAKEGLIRFRKNQFTLLP